jgi:hypothetical protein
LRKVALLAEEVVRDSTGGVESATLQDLRAAIADLHERFPYSVGPLFGNEVVVGQSVVRGARYAGPSGASH